jgi:hypothetical protein
MAAAASSLWVSGVVSGQVSRALPVTETFSYRGHLAQSVVVPAGTTVAEVRAIGGKGGGAYENSDHSGEYYTGGDGAQVSGEIAVTPGQVLTVKVAEYGGDSDYNRNPGKGGWGATGNGGRGGGATHGDGGGGGGATSVEIAGCETCTHSLVLLAGGGGAGGGRGYIGGGGGPGGSSGATVDPGHDGKGPGAGKGGGGGGNGTPAGGGGGNGSNLGGAGGGGGAGSTGGSGGGGGGLGGGGGGGGGAGSSQITSRLTKHNIIRGGTSDGNGLVSITWNEVSAPVCPDQTVHVPQDSPGVHVQLHCEQTSRPTSFRIVALPDHGLLDHRDLIKGTFTYVPRPGFAGTDSMMFQALSGDAASAPSTVTFEVSSPVRAGNATFYYVGHVAQSVTVPAGVAFAEVRAIGAQGGGTYENRDNSGKYFTGGDGAQVTGEIAVSPGEVLTVKVAEFGGDADANLNPGKGGWGATGNGGRGGGASTTDGAGGGGATNVEIADCKTCTHSLVLVAGGGGGAGGSGYIATADGGGPGGSSGATVDPGHDGKGPGAGKGGGGGGNGTPAGGGGGNGAHLGGAGGGGGAGSTGGSGGGGGGLGGGGGGGGAGSSQVTARLAKHTTIRGGTANGNGLVFLSWVDAVPVCLDQTVNVPRDSSGVHVQLQCSERARPSSFLIDAYPDHGHLDHRDLIKGTFAYVPLPGYTGTDRITFQGISDGVASARATVTFDIR